ncbi:beta-glucosidase [[Emmonsia] crescens]|uniref:Beta-glucosidase n=1 Tax=[Emmonsia] crescens TaxID=73230 RepID=A0A2B7ZQ69_9EURO|nr:beta-glucosidase [Emmonsia crescens]
MATTTSKLPSDFLGHSRQPAIKLKELLKLMAVALRSGIPSIISPERSQRVLWSDSDWVLPWDPENPADVEAANRKIEFSISWFADSIYSGKYPDSMLKQLGDRLPT